MKSLKAAAVVAGSLVIAGAAAPAFASDLTPTSLNGALDTITSQPTLDVQPLDSNVLDPKGDGVVDTVTGAAEGLNPGGAAQAPTDLLGGLPLAK
ncbi:hypothetical protein GTY65_06800 [Streptomyces sp. SID8379]|uniref:hypothetical protein n=1 Tax=unclassified Streptomyces TaxID=2593676 RepID=UPI0003604A58|nr:MULTISPECIES: hypothetical protein [unclassified Streptomyces]MYW63789.1 hypothetical protein [Streptomyces sp. SID8379]